MPLKNKLVETSIFHERHTPKSHIFNHKLCYFFLNFDKPLNTRFFSFNRANLFSLHFKDYGYSEFKDPKQYVIDSIAPFHPNLQSISSITLMTLPRVLGYGFNPISFWFCFNEKKECIAVLCEVNNTFKERHSYLCIHSDLRPIQSTDWFNADKVLFVSPFCEIKGKYDFRFDLSEEKVGVQINYSTEQGKLISTAINGRFKPLNDKNLLKYFLIYPLMTLKVIFLIHFHALCLWLKKVPHYTNLKKIKENNIT